MAAGGRTLFSVVIGKDTVKVRKRRARPARPMTPIQRKKPRRKPDHLAEMD